MTSTAIYAPIILIGAARSGTKFVRDLLARDDRIARVPYDINYVWRTGQQFLDHDALEPASLTSGHRKIIRNSLLRLAETNDGREPMIVEKTVSNCLRVPFVDAVFPEARFVHLVRDGRAVVESSLRLWQAPPDSGGLLRKIREIPPAQWDYLLWFGSNYLKGLMKGRAGGEVWGPRYPGILRDIEEKPLLDVVIRQWIECVSRASDDLAHLDDNRVFTIRYEDLMSSRSRLTELCSFVGIDDPRAVQDEFDRTAARDNVDKWRRTLDGNTQNEIETAAASVLRRFGYLGNEPL